MEPSRLETSTISHALFDTWWATVRDADFESRATFQFSQAWVGAITMLYEEDVAALEREGRFTSFERLNAFLDNFGFNVWPSQWRTLEIRKALGLSQEAEGLPSVPAEVS